MATGIWLENYNKYPVHYGFTIYFNIKVILLFYGGSCYPMFTLWKCGSIVMFTQQCYYYHFLFVITGREGTLGYLFYQSPKFYISYSFAQQLRVLLLNFYWLVHYVEYLNASTTNCNFVSNSLRMYVNLSANVLSLKIPE